MERIFLVQLTMSRAGRVPEIVLNAADADDLCRQVHRYASQFVLSSSFDVSVDLGEGKGWVEGGRFGTFTVEDRGDFAQDPQDRDHPEDSVIERQGGHNAATRQLTKPRGKKAGIR